MEYDRSLLLDILKILPHLPKPNLDDRTYKDLVEECQLRIPRYCPEWTHHNPADPGMTLIELFAWLTDQMLWRFNQVPWRQYISFLELLGVQLASATPAKTDLTFYLSRAQTSQQNIPSIHAGIEVSTERTDNQEAIIFSTDYRLDIGIPHIRNFLITHHIPATDSLELGIIQDGFQRWRPQDNMGYGWSGREQLIFQPIPENLNGFYLVLGANLLPDGQSQSLGGHVLALDIEGQLAGPTGINPKRPPRRWEAWNGESWRPVLLDEAHDETYGFSFDEMGQADQRGARRAAITLHMPLKWPETTFSTSTGATYTGCWLRCVYHAPNQTSQSRETDNRLGYQHSPRFTSLGVRAIGGTVPATQCMLVQDELLDKSTGKPGQQFPLRSNAILPRLPGEHIEVTLPGEEIPEIWTEVSDFADSGEDDRHYTLDSGTGMIQLGPLVREPAQLKAEMEFRRQVQAPVSDAAYTIDANLRSQRQYGKVPPKGAILRMTSYRTGGGQDGNVQPGALRILKSAVPYVTQVTNHKAASGGADRETLEQAVMRVPRMLRTRDRAVTPEDFETLAKQASSQIQRVKCLSLSEKSAGKVVVLLVPGQPTEAAQDERYGLTPELRETVEPFLQERSLLGLNVQVKAPEYIRVKVKADVLVDSVYQQREQDKAEIVQTLTDHLYRFLNPITGGWSGKGWSFGASLHASDVIGYLHKQQVTGVRAISNLQLFIWEPLQNSWSLRGEEISLLPLQLVDSWESEYDSFSGHLIELF